jgi:VWFA-related protein
LVFVIFVFFVIFVPERGPSAVSPEAQQPPATQAQQRPVFRGGTHFVRVDAYPVENGKIIEGLKPEDFEVQEDGKPQAIESFDFIRFDTFTPEAERREPNSQREGFDMAADPRNRVFVIVVDLPAASMNGHSTLDIDIKFIEQPLVHFLDRVLGPQDLYGFLTSRNSAKDLVLARRTTAVKAQILDMFRVKIMERDEADDALDRCRNNSDTLKNLYRDDQLYTSLETLVRQLGAIREERKSVIFVSKGLTRAKPNPRTVELNGPQVPKIGITNGRVGIGDRSDMGANDRFCTGEVQRLATIDFDDRYRALIRDARQENVSFYVINPAGLVAPSAGGDMRRVDAANGDLRSLADETDGLAIVNTNDLDGGMKRIGDDLAAYYVLGYYTTNTKWDGLVRRISVKARGKTIRARRQYRAPTEAEIATLASRSMQSAAPGASSASTVTPREAALTILERANRPFVPYVAAAGKTLTVVAELSAASIQAGRWKDGADVEVRAVGPNDEPLAAATGRIEAGTFSVAIPLTVGGAWPARVTLTLRAAGERQADDWVKLEPPSGTLVGEAVAYRAASRIAPRPVAGFEFARNERIRAEWPVLAPLDRREIRLLDRAGKPLPVELPLSEDSAKHTLVMEMSLSGLARGDYLIELTAGSGATIEHRLLAIRIKP